MDYYKDKNFNVEMENADSNLMIKMDRSLICSVNLEDILNLKSVTRKLLVLLENIESKATQWTKFSNMKCSTDNSLNEHDLLYNPVISTKSDAIVSTEGISSSVEALKVNEVPDFITSSKELFELESAAKLINVIRCEKDEDTDCSIYKKLTNVCQCLNKTAYNDFSIQFHSSNSYFNNTMGHIIKNVRILKQFLYMGTTYTRNTLLFLNDGLTCSTPAETVEIIQGCSHADICNIFERQSIVKFCINWASKYPAYGDSVTQSLAAKFLNKMSKIQEGRRYLNFNTKIAHDISTVLKKRNQLLTSPIVNVLEETLKLLRPDTDAIETDTMLYEYKPMREDMCNYTLQTLILHRRFMTFEEVTSHLNVLESLSLTSKGARILISKLKPILNVFKRLAVDYDSFELNKIITRIILNIILYVKKNQKGTKPIEKRQSLTICVQPLNISKPSLCALTLHNFSDARTKTQADTKIKQINSLFYENKKLPKSVLMNYINQSFNTPPKRCVRQVGRSKHKRRSSRKITSSTKRSPIPSLRQSIFNKSISIPKSKLSLDKVPIPKCTRNPLKEIKEKDEDATNVSATLRFKVPSKLFKSIESLSKNKFND